MKINLLEIPVYYINLERDVDKNNKMMTMLSEVGFKQIERIGGVLDLQNSVAGCSKAHHKALSTLTSPFILFEDDCILCEENFKSIIEIPDDADALYLGISTWGRMNGHEGECIQYDKVNNYTNIFRIYNMLGGHSIIYFNNFYRELCEKIAYHAGYVIENYQDIGFAEVQKFFKIYSLNDPFFYQTSNLWTKNSITSLSMSEYMTYDPLHFKSYRIR